MKVSTEKFQEAFCVVDAVSVHNTLMSSQFVRLVSKGGTLRLSMTGMMYGDAVIKPLVDEAWEFFVDRKALSAFLFSASGEIVITNKKNELSLECQSQSMTLQPPKDPISGYVAWPVTEKVGLKSVGPFIGFLSGFAAKEPGNERLSAIKLIKGYGTMATDSVTMVAILDPAATLDVNIPPQLAPYVMRAGGNEVLVGKTGVGVELPAGRLYQIGNVQLKQYPTDQLRGILDKAKAASPMFKVGARIMEEVLTGIEKFNADGVPEVTLEGSVLKLRVALVGGEVNRVVGVKLQMAGKAGFSKLSWAVEKPRLWFKHIADLKDGAEVECARMNDASATVLRYTEGKRVHLLVFTDM